MKYRREIDGLRALAVLPVILFHAGLKGFQGGFVGVDVFFVISGYLITGILLADLRLQRFSIIDFYERRARRILPALFLVLLVCLPCAWFWLLPPAMKEFSKSLIAVSAFASNILFWRISGYFDSDVGLKPLLHTWSLAVEEQYYVLFPVFLLLVWKLNRRWLLGVTLLIVIASLGAAQWLSAIEPGTAFYLLPTRAWEILMGALLAFHHTTAPRVAASSPWRTLGGLAGIAFIVFAVFCFDETIPFPGLYALIPTLGAVLIIECATAENFAGRLLGQRWLVGIGLISYSAYLWHQPLFAFARQALPDRPGPGLLVALGGLSLALGYVSWRFVEKPFRTPGVFSRRAIFGGALIGTLLFSGIGLAGYRSQGFQGRYSGPRAAFMARFDNSLPNWRYFTRLNMEQETREQCNFYDLEKYRAGHVTVIPRPRIANECFLRDPRKPRALLVWGDSHAQQLYAGLRKEMPQDWDLLQVASSGCSPRLDALPDAQNYCNYSNWFAMKTIAATRPDVVIVGQTLHHDPTTMKAVAHRLLSMGVGKVFFTGPTPHWQLELPSIVVKFWDHVPRYTRAYLDINLLVGETPLKKALSTDPDVHYISLTDYFCITDGCLVYLGDDVEKGLTAYDSSHLTPIASRALAHDVLVPRILRETPMAPTPAAGYRAESGAPAPVPPVVQSISTSRH